MLKPEAIDLGRSLQEFRPVLQRLLRADVVIEIDAPETTARVLVDRSCLEQVLLNLAVNARDAMPGGGRMVLSARTIAAGEDETGWAVLSVRDTGQGMDKATLERVFEPFYTTKADGTGLGLATVLDIVKRSNGRVEVHSEEGVGTTFDVFFPALRDIAEEVGTTSTRRAPRGTELLLVVDDESAVRATTRRILERAGYSVLEAGSAAEALSLIDANQGIALVLSDVVMPGRGGIELAGDVAKLGKRVLLLSGYAEAVRSEVAWPLLPKPYASLDLLIKVRETLDRESASRAS
jgi:CheY-like chemotaxis protein